MNPNANGGTIQLQTQYGIETRNEDEGSGRKRETVPPLPPPPPKSVLKTERPSYYYNSNLNDIFASTPPAYSVHPTPPTIYHRPSHSGYTRTTGNKNSNNIFL